MILQLSFQEKKFTYQIFFFHSLGFHNLRKRERGRGGERENKCLPFTVSPTERKSSKISQKILNSLRNEHSLQQSFRQSQTIDKFVIVQCRAVANILLSNTNTAYTPLVTTVICKTTTSAVGPYYYQAMGMFLPVFIYTPSAQQPNN